MKGEVVRDKNLVEMETPIREGRSIGEKGTNITLKKMRWQSEEETEEGAPTGEHMVKKSKEESGREINE